jgi:nucleotide-binding universal stress UspA family protein
MELLKVNVKNILYATDLSENARYAFAYAISLANLYKANLFLLHVLSDVSELVDKHIIGYISESQWETIKESHLQEAKEALIGKRRERALISEILDEFSEKAKADFGKHAIPSDEIIVKKGNPVTVILETADEKKCDLIVMGTHGRGTLADAMMGSTARRVIRRSSKPVLVVRLPEDVS